MPPQGTITDITGHPWAGLYQIHFEDGALAHLDSGIGARNLAQAYGSLRAAIGRSIYYETDDLNVMTWFAPLEEMEE